MVRVLQLLYTQKHFSFQWGILLAERLSERDVKKVSINQTLEGDARLHTQKNATISY